VNNRRINRYNFFLYNLACTPKWFNLVLVLMIQWKLIDDIEMLIIFVAEDNNITLFRNIQTIKSIPFFIIKFRNKLHLIVINCKDKNVAEICSNSYTFHFSLISPTICCTTKIIISTFFEYCFTILYYFVLRVLLVKKKFHFMYLIEWFL